jgi:hypothetical protein
MADMPEIHDPEEIAAFIDGRLGADKAPRLLERLSRERGLFVQFIHAGKAVIGKHAEPPKEEIAALKGLVRSSAMDFIRRNLVWLVIVDTVIMLALVVFLLVMFTGDGDDARSGRTYRRTVHRGKPPIPSRQHPDSTGKTAAPTKTGGGTADGESGGKGAKADEKTAEISKNPKKFFDAFCAAKEDERKTLLGPLALAGAPVLKYLSDAVQKGDLDNSARTCALAVLEEMWKKKSPGADLAAKYWEAVKYIASSDPETTLRREAMRIAVEGGYPDAFNMLRDALMAKNEEEVRTAAIELLAKGPFQKDAPLEMLKALRNDDSDDVKAAVIRCADEAKIKPDDLFADVRGCLSSASADLKLEAVEYLVKHVSSTPQADRAGAFLALKSMISAAVETRPEEGETPENTPALSRSEKDAMKAADVFFKNFDWKRTEGKGNFLSYGEMGASKQVRRHIILAFIGKKDALAVKDLIAELRAASDDDREFVKSAVEKVQSAYKLPARTAEDAKAAPPGAAADLLAEWWRDAEPPAEDDRNE